jgi:dihydropteridine reductase
MLLRQGFRRALTTASRPASEHRVLVVGGAGVLGRTVIDVFNDAKWTTISADVSPTTSGSVNVKMDAASPWKQQALQLRAEVSKVGHVDAIICTAGGWQGV